MSDVVIIGAGECGVRAGFALREIGYQGSITLVGEEAHPPYERPPLSKAADRVPLKAIGSPERFADASIIFRQGQRVEDLDAERKTLLLSDGERLGFGRLLLATGAVPRRLACPGGALALPFRTFADAELVFHRAGSARRAVIIGGGLIGMEVAAVLRWRGLDVSVIEAAPRPLTRAVPSRFANALHARHVLEGVHFHLGIGVAAITEGRVILADGAELAADVVIQAIGVRANTDLAERAGLAIADGIVTDRQLHTSAPDIFAAGDCAAVAHPAGGYRRSESWRNARAQAETAARNIAGNADVYSGLPSFWSDQYDLSLQVVGEPSPAHDRVVRQRPGGEVEFYLAEGRLVAAAGLAPGNIVARDIKLAEMLLVAGQSPDASLLADPKIDLKQFLRR